MSCSLGKRAFLLKSECYKVRRASQVALEVKNLLANAGDIKMWVRSLGWEDPLEEGMATHSSILAWRIPWTEEPGGLWSMESQRVGHDWSHLARMRFFLSRFFLGSKGQFSNLQPWLKMFIPTSGVWPWLWTIFFKSTPFWNVSTSFSLILNSDISGLTALCVGHILLRKALEWIKMPHFMVRWGNSYSC